MFNRRTITLLILSTLPVLIYVGISIYALLKVDLFIWTWLIPVAWILAWVISKVWRVPQRSISGPKIEIPDHWTPQDIQAVDIVYRHRADVTKLEALNLLDLHFYLSKAEHLGEELARHYHPKSKDAFSSLTPAEVLAATRLAVDDLEAWFTENVPGGNLATISMFKKLKHLPGLIENTNTLVWAGSIWWNPANLIKLVANNLTNPSVQKDLKSEFVVMAYMQFIELVGFYLIEMNSGRLKAGAQRYIEHYPSRYKQRLTGADAAQLKLESLSVAIVGQVKAGKSSLVNLLLGEQSATSDVLPATSSVNRYQMQVPDSDVQFVLLDTPGYADAGITKSQTTEIEHALKEADVILFVLAANSPARSADQDVMDKIVAWQTHNKKLKPTPIIVCLTHIDLLSPAMEWKPPYDWREPKTPKAESIHNAVKYAVELFEKQLSGIVPVCTDVARNRASKVDEELLPALASVLSNAKTASLLKLYHQGIDSQRWSMLKSQLLQLGKQAALTYLDKKLLLKTWKDSTR